jgi:hypothetical protein
LSGVQLVEADDLEGALQENSHAVESEYVSIALLGLLGTLLAFYLFKIQ